MTPALAIIVATRDREAMLGRMLASALAMRDVQRATLELVVADDGSRDTTRLVVAEAARHHGGIRYLAVPDRGTSHALNQAIRATSAPVLAFLDDDVVFDPGWLVAVEGYFTRERAAAAQGTIRIPPDAADDPAIVAAVERWRTIPRCDLGPHATESRSLIGANMLIARETFARAGLFDERLGPGAAGACEDTELALRIRATGARIGYIPDAIVYHAVEPTRLNLEYFRMLHLRRGRSRVYYKHAGLASRILPNLGLAGLRLIATAPIRRGVTHARALGRWYHYRGMLEAHRAARLPGGAPPLQVT